MNDCDCCQGAGIETPVRVNNRPGLSGVAYRIGTHSRFKASMLARLAGLVALKTRADDDFSIALLDAWATVADVLTFYQERIANESYLRTATERNSLVQLARLIGYHPRPGVAASTYLAFTIENAPSAPGTAVLGVGTKVQSVPGPNEQPQIFETIEALGADAHWNELKPRMTLPQPISTGMGEIFLKGTSTRLAKGDALIIAPNGWGSLNKELRRVSDVAPDDKKQQTRVELVASGTRFLLPGLAMPGFALGHFESRPVSITTGVVENEILNKSWDASDLNAYARYQGVSSNALYSMIRAITPKPADTPILAMRKRAPLFGYNAPDWKAMAEHTQDVYKGAVGATDPLTEWPTYPGNAKNTLYLDQVYKEVKTGDWVAVSRKDNVVAITQISDVQETAVAWYALSGQVTAITFGSDVAPSGMDELRQTRVYIIPEALEPDELADTSAVAGSTIPLNAAVPGLTPGQTVIVSGTLTTRADVQAAEAAVISRVTLEGGKTVLALVGGLEYSYVRESVTINGNVALATHGETTRETLGAGDAAQPYQQFTLRQSPLTYVPASNATGAASTLQVFVNEVQWHERDSLLDAGPRDRVFVTQTADDPSGSAQAGKTTVEFGDGSTGARVPTGRDNVRAVYRKGMGSGGNVQAGQLSVLMSRPLGVKDAINPMPATGGADAETLAQARSNAPLPILALERTVSLRDYQDFARAFAGIGKALATWTWDGQTRGVFMTIAGSDGAAVSHEALTYKSLLNAMQNAGDPYVPLRVGTYRPVFFQVSAKIKLDPDYAANSDKVLAAVEGALRAAYAFEARQFGEPVQLSRVIALMQDVPGVVAVDVDGLFRTGDTPAPVPPPRLLAAFPQPGAEGSVNPAELLLLDPRPVKLSVLK